MLFVSLSFMGEHPEHPEHPSKATAAVTAQVVGKAVAEFISSDTELKGGKFFAF